MKMLKKDLEYFKIFENDYVSIIDLALNDFCCKFVVFCIFISMLYTNTRNNC